jgi:HSP20 family protein
MRRFGEDMEHFFEDFNRDFFTPIRSELNLFGDGRNKALWSPKIEVLEKNGKLLVRAELPGLNKDDIKVELTDEALTLSGERKEEKEEKGEGYYRSERSYGSFYRAILLPDGIDATKAVATFDKGILEIAMDVPAKKPLARTIPIKELKVEEVAKAKVV